MSSYRKLGQGRFTGGSALTTNENEGLDSLLKKNALKREYFINPVAGASNIHAQFVADFSTAAGITQPDVPRNLQVIFGAAWGGGNCVATGYCADGVIRSETFVAIAGGNTAVGTYAFLKVTLLANTGTFSAGTCDVQLAAAASTVFGVASRNPSEFIQLTSGAAVEAIVAQSLPLGTFRPTTVPNGATMYRIAYLIDEVGDRASNEP